MRTFLAATALLAGTMLAQAEPVIVGDLQFETMTIRDTPANAPVSGGYVVIRNTGATDDRLIGGSADFANKTEVHEMVMDGDVMKMREVAGLPIPAGETVVLQPGGFHVMFMQLNEQMATGDTHRVTLTFEKAGAVELDFTVKTLPEIRKDFGGMAGGHGSMKMGN